MCLKVGYKDTDDNESNDGARTFEVFQGVLCFYSGYFEAMFSHPWQEGQHQSMQLRTEDPYIVDFFVHGIHTRHFYDSTLEPYLLMDYLTLSRIRIFADAHDIPMLQNEVMDLLQQKLRCTVSFFSTEEIEYIIETTNPNAELRQLVIDSARGLLLATFEFSGSETREVLMEESLPMIAVLVNSTLTHLRKENSSALTKVYNKVSLLRSCSRLHVHRDGQKCPSPKFTRKG